MSRKKICFVAQFPPPMHGLSKAVETLYNSELAQEFDFEKVDISDNKKILSSLIAIKKSKADLFYFTISQSVGGNRRDLLILNAIGNRPCLIHLHGGYYRTLVNNDMPKWQQILNYKAIKKVDGVIALGPSLKWIFEGMIRPDHIYTIPNCVDDEYLMSDEDFLNKIASLPDRKIKHVLYLSNFIRSKGYPELLRMARIEKKRGGERRFHFDFAGKFFENKEEEYFWNYVDRYDLRDYITYHGVVDGDEKRELLRLCDVFCLLTTYPNEGQPISILEAMGNGMVVVTTRHAGIPDIIDPNCSLCIAKDYKDKAHYIYEKLFRFDYSMMEKVGRNKVLQCYTQQEYINNMKKQFVQLLY